MFYIKSADSIRASSIFFFFLKPSFLFGVCFLHKTQRHESETKGRLGCRGSSALELSWMFFFIMLLIVAGLVPR